MCDISMLKHWKAVLNWLHIYLMVKFKPLAPHDGFMKNMTTINRLGPSPSTVSTNGSIQFSWVHLDPHRLLCVFQYKFSICHVHHWRDHHHGCAERWQGVLMWFQIKLHIYGNSFSDSSIRMISVSVFPFSILQVSKSQIIIIGTISKLIRFDKYDLDDGRLVIVLMRLDHHHHWHEMLHSNVWFGRVP